MIRKLGVGLLAAVAIHAGAQSPDARRESLLAADRALADAASKSGFRASLTGALSSDATLLYPGAPVVRGVDKIRALLAVQPLLDSVSIGWRANDAVLSADGEWGMTHGLVVVVPRAGRDSTVRNGNYAMVWHRVDTGRWELVAAVHIAIVPPQRTVIPDGLGPRELPPAIAVAATTPFIDADLAFTRMATDTDPGNAFRSFASPSAVLYSPQNEVRRGPDEIAAPFAGRPPVDWTWHPVVAGAARDGSFGFTIGESRSRPRGDAAAAPNLSKYLTVWRRERDGSVKYIYDGGNVRP